jgi:hypothetical protein
MTRLRSKRERKLLRNFIFSKIALELPSQGSPYTSWDPQEQGKLLY